MPSGGSVDLNLCKAGWLVSAASVRLVWSQHLLVSASFGLQLAFFILREGGLLNLVSFRDFLKLF